MDENFIDLADSVGAFIEHWGFSRIDGRIWTLIYLSKVSIDTPQIIEFTRMSKASVSLSLKKLLKYDLIEQKQTHNKGIQSYQSAPNVLESIFKVLKEREMKLILEAKEACNFLSESNVKRDEFDQDRVLLLQELIQNSYNGLKFLLSQDEKTMKGFSKLMCMFNKVI